MKKRQHGAKCPYSDYFANSDPWYHSLDSIIPQVFQRGGFSEIESPRYLLKNLLP